MDDSGPREPDGVTSGVCPSLDTRGRGVASPASESQPVTSRCRSSWSHEPSTQCDHSLPPTLTVTDRQTDGRTSDNVVFHLERNVQHTTCVSRSPAYNPNPFLTLILSLYITLTPLILYTCRPKTNAKPNPILTPLTLTLFQHVAQKFPPLSTAEWSECGRAGGCHAVNTTWRGRSPCVERSMTSTRTSCVRTSRLLPLHWHRPASASATTRPPARPSSPAAAAAAAARWLRSSSSRPSRRHRRRRCWSVTKTTAAEPCSAPRRRPIRSVCASTTNSRLHRTDLCFLLVSIARTALMRAISIQMSLCSRIEWSLCLFVCLSRCVCDLFTTLSPTKTVEPFEMPFGRRTHVGRGNDVLDGDTYTRHLASTIKRSKMTAIQYCRNLLSVVPYSLRCTTTIQWHPTDA